MATRLIVKGLPKNVDSAALRAHFATLSPVTDAKVLNTKDGRSRQFGFVGFETHGDAKTARNALNNTFLHTGKLSIEFAKSFGDDSLPRAWSKHAAPRSAPASAPAAAASRGKTGGANGDPAQRGKSTKDDAEFREFQAVVKQRKSKPLWADDDAGPRADDPPARPKRRERVQSVRKTEAGGVEKEVLVESRKTGGQGVFLKKTHVVFGSDGEDEGEEEEGGEGAAKVKESLAHDTNVTDMDYFKSKISTVFEKEVTEQLPGDNDSQGNASEGESEEVKSDVEPEAIPKAEEEVANPIAADDEDDASVSGRLFVRNLAYSVTEADLESLFEEFGALAEVHLCVDRETKISKGTAFILFALPENAVKAMSSLDGVIFKGRLLHILPAKKKPTSEVKIAKNMSSYKQSQATEKREDVKRGTDAGTGKSALLMASDAVANEIASRLQVSKEILYGTDTGESGNAAVRLAIGEARLQEETRKALLAEGVDLSKFQTGAGQGKLSKTIIIAKNLPYGTTELDLEHKFAEFGELVRVICGPSGLIGIVEFIDSSDARKAYNGLAYSRFKDSPLYLDWAPNDCLKPQMKPVQKEATPPLTDAAKTEPAQNDPVDNNTLVPTSIFIKNVNFDSTEEALSNPFRRIEGFRLLSIAKKVDQKNPSGPKLSMGYGFCEFGSKGQALDAIKRLQGVSVDGHSLELKLSEKTGEKKSSQKSKRDRGKTSKLLVKNVAFEATVQDIRNLFKAFGQVKNVRLPKKFDGTPRGFAFVSFVSDGEAEAAKNALNDAHLYGRHLVIEYAEDENENLDELVAKATKKAKKSVEQRPERSKREETDGGYGEMYG